MFLLLWQNNKLTAVSPELLPNVKDRRIAGNHWRIGNKNYQYFKVIWYFSLIFFNPICHFAKTSTLTCNANQGIGFYVTTALGRNWSTSSNHLITKFVTNKRKSKRISILKFNNSCKCNPPMIHLLLLWSLWWPKITILSFFLNASFFCLLQI